MSTRPPQQAAKEPLPKTAKSTPVIPLWPTNTTDHQDLRYKYISFLQSTQKKSTNDTKYILTLFKNRSLI